jgi:hypothetical protein
VGGPHCPLALLLLACVFPLSAGEDVCVWVMVWVDAIVGDNSVGCGVCQIFRLTLCLLMIDLLLCNECLLHISSGVILF